MEWTQLADLREYSANPWVRELNAVAIRDKHRHQKHEKRHLSLTAIRWPQQVRIGAVISWEEYQQGVNDSKGRWATRQGRVVSVNRWHLTVDVGKYITSILLKDLFIGRVRMD